MYANAKSSRLLSYAAIAVCLMNICVAPVAAQSLPGSFGGTNQSLACVGGDEKCAGFALNKPSIKATIDWKVGFLVGEPVIDTRIAWKPDAVFASVKGLVPQIYSEADPDLFYKAGEAAAQLRLYEAKARLTVHHGNQTYTIDSDLGVPDVAGDKSSYNVPGSPDWSRMFRDQNGAFIPAGLAKEIMISGSMAGAEATLVSAKMDTSKFEGWWLDKNVDRYAAPLRAAIDGRLAALEVSFGLPTADLRAEIAGLGAGLSSKALVDKLETILRKLAPDRIPAKFLGEGPEKLAKLHRYAQLVAPTESALRDATKGLPPMPGSSKAYETWYDQVAVRMNTDAARLAHLQGLEEDALRAEAEAEAARQRERDRIAADLLRSQNAPTENPHRRKSASAGPLPGTEEHDDSYYYSPGDSGGFADTGWGNGGYGSVTGLMNSYAIPGSGTYYSETTGTYQSEQEGHGYGCDSEWAALESDTSAPKPASNDSEAWKPVYEETRRLDRAFQDCMTRNGY